MKFKPLHKKGGAPIDQLVGFVSYILFIAFFGFILYLAISSKSEKIQYVDNGIIIGAQKHLRDFSTQYYDEIVKAAETGNQKELNKITEDFFVDKLQTQKMGWMIVFKNSENLIVLNRIGVDTESLVFVGNTILAAENYLPLQTKNKDYLKLELHLGTTKRKS